MRRPTAVRRNGETNPVTIILILALTAAGFYGYHVGPVYWDNLEAKEACAQAFNLYWLNGAESAKSTMLFRLNSKVGKHLEVDDDGVERWLPGLGVDPDNVIIEETAGTLTVRVTYDRVVHFKPLKKRKVFHVVAEKVGQKLQ